MFVGVWQGLPKHLTGLLRCRPGSSHLETPVSKRCSNGFLEMNAAGCLAGSVSQREFVLCIELLSKLINKIMGLLSSYKYINICSDTKLTKRKMQCGFQSALVCLSIFPLAFPKVQTRHIACRLGKRIQNTQSRGIVSSFIKQNPAYGRNGISQSVHIVATIFFLFKSKYNLKIFIMKICHNVFLCQNFSLLIQLYFFCSKPFFLGGGMEGVITIKKKVNMFECSRFYITYFS